MTVKPWEPWEDEILLACERTAAGYADVARRVGRTVQAAMCRRCNIDRLGHVRRRWSAADDDVLRRGDPNEIAKLDRTANAIEIRSRRLRRGRR